MDREQFLSGKEKALIISFLADNSVDTAEFNMADDLLSDKPLISSLTSLSYSWTEFISLKRTYEAGQTFVKKSKLKSDIENIE